MYGNDILRLDAVITLLVSQAGLLEVSAIAALTMQTKPNQSKCVQSAKNG